MSEPATGATRAELPPPDPRNAQQAAPPLPTETIAGVQADVAAVKESVSR